MLSSPQCSGPLARLRDEFGANSAEAIDNTINLLFAGFDSTSSTITYMIWLLAKHPSVLEQVRCGSVCGFDEHGVYARSAFNASCRVRAAVLPRSTLAEQLRAGAANTTLHAVRHSSGCSAV